MRKFLLRSALFVIAIAQSQAAVLITEVMSSSLHPTGGTNNGDWFELTNTGAATLDINGWTWDDSSATAGSATFGSLTSIAPGQSVIISQEAIGAEAQWLADWGISGVVVVNLGDLVFQNFSASGDQIHIYNALGVEMAALAFGAATAGDSFAYDTAGTALGVSNAGVQGAFKAVSDGLGGPGVDVGSPGYVYPAAVPEPGTVTLAMLGLMAGIFLLRRKRLAR
jgi:hypothetical protein